MLASLSIPLNYPGFVLCFLKVHCHAIQWFFAPFCCGEKNGGRASFQAKRAQQVSCLSIIVVYIVLYMCSEIYTTARESLASLERSCWPRQLKINPSRSKPVLVSMNFPYFSWANLSFCFHFLDLISKPIFVRERNDFARVTDWYPDVDWSRSSKLVKKKVRQRPACRWPTPRPRVSSPPFSTAKNLHKIPE